MSRVTASALEPTEIDAFLNDQSTGTLSLANDSDAYAVPVSFTFDDDSRNVYFRLGYGPDSQKRQFIDATETATFVVADETASGWKSVIAQGEVEHLSTVEDLNTSHPRGSADPSVNQAIRNLEIPYYQVFDDPSEMVFTIARLRTDELTGVVEADDDDGRSQRSDPQT